MNMRILQLKDLSKTKYGLMSYDFACEHGFNLEDYKCVYEENIDSDNDLDDIFRMFNRVTQEDCERLEAIGFKGHSLSVSDIVDLEGHMFYCDSFGWIELK